MHTITDAIHWVGYIDWNLRNFHGYITPKGSTYNAYLIMDEKPTLIDTVKYYGFDEMLERIRAVIAPEKIAYIISNHTEMDHSGTIDRLLSYCPNATVVCSPKGHEHLKRHFKKEWKFKEVQDGETLTIGARTLQFILTPMVHWPDNMVTYSPHDNILFSNDGFGQHYASTERYADTVGIEEVYREAAKYYANIVLPYGTQVMKALGALGGLAIDMICPSHGLIWRRADDIARIIAGYRQWAQHETERRVVIVYDTMWKTTERLANYLFRRLDVNGIPVKLISLQHADVSEIMTEILYARVALFGSPILNNRILPTMAALLMYMKGLKPKSRYAGTFGSYGWATVGFKELESSLAEAGFEPLTDGFYTKFIPDETELAGLDGIIKAVGGKVNT